MASQFVKNMAQQTKKKKQQQDAAVDALKSRSGKSVTQVEQSLSNKSIQSAAKKVNGTSTSRPTPARQLSKPTKKADDTWNSSVNGGSSSFVKTMAQNQRAHYEEINRNAAVDAMKQRFRNTQNTHTDYNDSFSNDSAVTQKKATASNAQKNSFTYSPSYIHSQKMMAQDNSTLALSDAQKKNMPKNITVKNQNEPNARVVDQSFKNFNPNDPNYSTPADERSYRNTREGAYAYKHPIAGVASHVINNIGSGFEGIAGTAYQAVTGKKLDDQFFKGTYAAQDAQSGVRRRVQDATGGRQDGISTTGENAAGFLADTGMSILDSAANRALASYFAPGKAGEVGGLALMAGGAAAGQLTDLNQNEKVSGRRAAVDAAANGAFEYLSEKLSWDKLNAFKDMEVSPHNVGEVIKRIAQQAATEGGEEVFSTLADAAADSLILGNEAEYVGQYNAYKGSGMSNGEAMQNVVYNLLKESALSFLGGAISGGVMGSGATVMNYMNAKANQNFTEDELRQTADAIDTSPEAYTREDGTIDTQGLDQAIATMEKLSGYANKLANGDILTLEEQQDIYDGVESTIDRAAEAKGVAPVITEDKNLDEMVNDWIEEATAQEEEHQKSEPIASTSTPEEAKASTQAAIEAMNSPVNVVDETAAEPVTESQTSQAEQLATGLAHESAQGTNENLSEEYMDAQDMKPDTAMSGQADDIVDVTNIVPEDDAPTLPDIKEFSNQYTGNVKTSFENGYEGVDILWYDDNMRKVYQAAVKGETLRDLMQNDTDFQKFFSSPYGDAVLPFYDAAYAEGVKTTGGNDYGDLHNNDEVRDEGAVRQPVEVREGDLGGSHPVRAEEVTDDAAGRQPVSDLEEVGGSDVGSVSGSSGRGVSGQRSTGSSTGDQVSDHVGGRDGGVTPPELVQSAQTSLSVDEANVPKLKEVIGSEFSKADELAATRKRATEIEQELLANNAEAVSDAKENSEGGVYARKLKAAGVKPKAAAGKPVSGRSAVQGFISQTSDARPQDWTAEKNTNSTVEHAKPLAEIIGKAMHDFGINLDTGYVRGAGVTGQYNTNDKGLRTKIANDLPSVSHEFGHWLDDKYNILKDTAIPKAVEEDFQKAFEKEPGNKAAYDPSLHKIEGVAEFIRYYLQNKDTAAIDYPAATEYIKKKITNPTELARFEQFADEVNAYYSEGAKSAASALVYKENRISDYRTTKEKAQDAVDKRIQEWVDSNHAIRLLDRKTGGKAYVMASNSAYSEARAKQILEGDLLDINGNYVGHGLKWALQGINTVNKAEYTAFNEYLTVLHGIEWIENGKRVFADDRMNNRQWMASRALELENEYPKFKEAAKRVFEFTDLFTRTYGLGTGLISKDRYLAMKKLYQRYVPFFRAGFKNRGNSLAKAKGSGRQIIMPVDNIMDMVNKMVSTATRNSTLLEIRKASTELGADATLLERIPDPKVPKQINISDLKQEIYESADGREMSADALDVLDDVLGTLDDVYTQFELGKANQKKGEICILVDGKPEFWKVNDELLLDSISNMSPGHLGAVLGTYGKITKFMTANITGNNIIWSAFSNAPRDLQTMFNYAKQTKNPSKLFSGIASAYLNSFKEANGKEVSPLYREYLAMGGGNTGVWQGSEKYAADIRKSLNSTGMNKKGNADHFYKHPVSSFFGAISVLSNTIEQGPRFAIYSLCRQQGMTQQEAFYEATDITVNFRRHGTNSKAANAVIPFFNAGIQSTDKTIRYFTGEDLKGTKYTAKQRGKIIFQRWAFLAVTSMIMTAIEYALNHKSKDDKENYNQLSNHVKNSNFLIPLGKGKYFALTKSHELGIPSSAMERILELTQDDQDHAFDDFAAYATSNFLPSIVSDLVEMPFNVASEGLYDASKDALTGAISSTGIFGVGAAINANKDYLGSPIVSSSLEGKVPKQQYTARTSHAAYLMGQFLNLSPQQIDYFGKNVLGGYWTYQTALFPVNDGKGVKGKRDWTLGVKNTYNKDNIYSQDLANWMYDKADESSMYAKSYPDNKTYLLESSQDSAMTSYYSRAMGLVKDNADSAEYRIVKQSLLDSIKTYQKKSDRNAWTSAEKSVQNFVKRTGNKNVLPGALNTEITDSEGKKHSLKGREYIQYQKTYEQAYWKYVKEQFTGKKFSDEDAAQVLSTIKKTAKDVADATILKQKGVKVAKSSSGFNSYKSAASDKLKAKDKDANLSAKDVYNLAVDYAKANGLDAKTEYYNALSDDQQKKYDEWEKYGGTFDTYDEYLGTRDFKASTYEESGESVSGSKKYKIAKYLVEQVQNNTLSYNQAEVAWELSGYNSKKEKSDTLDDYYGSSEWYKLQNILGY